MLIKLYFVKVTVESVYGFVSETKDHSYNGFLYKNK